MPAKLIFLQGLPASGKTTWAKDEVRLSGGQVKRVNKDDLRAMIDSGKWSSGREKFILDIRDSIVSMYLREGYDVIVDDTNFEVKHLNRMREIAVSCRARFEQKFFDVPVSECVLRDSKRESPVGEDVIRKMWNRYLKPEIEGQEELPSAVICDIDGTLADIGERNPYDASNCDKDSVNTSVKGILSAFHDNGTKIILVSGRSSEYRQKTEEWLKRNDVQYQFLFMRAEGDTRKDDVVKKEIYERNIAGKYDVDFVLDDRNRVVAMWREQGLHCFQVDYGNF